MTKTLCRIVFLATFALAAAFAHADDEPVAGTSWHINEQTDQITDAVSYLIATMAKESVSQSPFADRTLLVVRIEPKCRTTKNEMRFKQRLFIHHNGGSFNVDSAKITTRFNREKATTSTWITLPPSYELAVAPDSDAMISRLETSTNLIIRFTTIIGETKTLTFNIDGFTNALHRVKLKYLETNPPTIPETEPSAAPKPTAPTKRTAAASKPPCRKCKGKGTTTGWINCPQCNGAVMPGGSRCKLCIRSIHVGKVRGEIPCPVCHPNADTSTQSVGFGRSK